MFVGLMSLLTFGYLFLKKPSVEPDSSKARAKATEISRVSDKTTAKQAPTGALPKAEASDPARRDQQIRSQDKLLSEADNRDVVNDIALDERLHELSTLLDSQNRAKVNEALFQIAKTGARGFVLFDEVRQFLSADDPKLQEVAAFAIAKMGKNAVAKALPELVKLLSSKDKAVKSTAVFALGTGDELSENASTPIARLLDNRDQKLVKDALYALSRIGPSAGGAAGQVQKLLADKTASIREEAAFVLGRMREEAVIAADALEELSARDPSPKVREAAKNALRLIDGGKKFRKKKDFSSSSASF